MVSKMVGFSSWIMYFYNPDANKMGAGIHTNIHDWVILWRVKCWYINLQAPFCSHMGNGDVNRIWDLLDPTIFQPFLGKVGWTHGVWFPWGKYTKTKKHNFLSWSLVILVLQWRWNVPNHQPEYDLYGHDLWSCNEDEIRCWSKWSPWLGHQVSDGFPEFF